ncbi:conjugal transfer protein TraF [Marinimicrobium sp. ABcell2]|uniref:conjugal transfer protein TraF n=1 Tax=Marinimicrobium sp. ABcell2 TaxID=3069751 RepID=UPI0027B7376D|nr:conjugal transfer protein TraF [Marinimicrobium sp. ABcell2]MDQ2075362.1 conjugal transfer protein TraF [Marinimicrobium sp. ABcell2]
MRVFTLVVGFLSLSTLASQSWAVSFLSFDARSMSMGSTGVVMARSHNASLFNPALLIDTDPKRQTRFHMHTYAGARLLDRDNFLDTADQFRTRYEGMTLDELLDIDLNLAPTEFASGDELRAATGRIRAAQADINGLSNKPLRVSASYGWSFSYPTTHWSIGGYVREFAVLGSMVNVADADNAAIDRLANTVESFANLLDEVIELRESTEGRTRFTLEEVIDRADPLVDAIWDLNRYVNFPELRSDVQLGVASDRNVQEYLREPLPDGFQSTIDSRGAEVTEQAISVARSFNGGEALPGLIHLGINFKYVDFTTISFSQPVDEFSLSAYREDEYRLSHRRFNMDMGMVYGPSDQVHIGLVVRNLIPRDFATVDGEPIPLRPIARMGIGYRNRNVNLTADLDVTRNEPLGFDPDKQYLGLGAEWFAWRNTALRAGLRYNTVDGETLPSLGFGLGGRHGHLDLAVAKSSNGDEWGLAFQAGLAF